MPRKEILFIGDSLIEFFDWAGRFPDHKVHNMGRAGETVEGLLNRMGRELDAWPAFDYVFIMSGANNIAIEETGFIAEYREIATRFKPQSPGAKVYINSILPTLMPWIRPELITQVNGYLKKVAEETEATYLNIHSLFLDAGLGACLLPDGVHISARGYEVWSGKVEEIIG